MAATRMGHIMEVTRSWDLPAEDTAPGIARALLNTWIGPGPAAADAVLIASELVSNAVRHGHAPITLEAVRAGGSLEIAVECGHHDGDAVPEVTRPSTGRAAGGQGLRIVAACSTAWAWSITGDRLRVQATVVDQSAGAASPASGSPAHEG